MKLYGPELKVVLVRGVLPACASEELSHIQSARQTSRLDLRDHDSGRPAWLTVVDGVCIIVPWVDLLAYFYKLGWSRLEVWGNTQGKGSQGKRLTSGNLSTPSYAIQSRWQQGFGRRILQFRKESKNPLNVYANLVCNFMQQARLVPQTMHWVFTASHDTGIDLHRLYGMQ